MTPPSHSSSTTDRRRAPSPTSGVTPCLFGLAFVMLEQRVQFLDQRLHLERHGLVDAAGLSGAHFGDRRLKPAQGPETVDGLERGKHDETDGKQREAARQGAAERRDLVVELGAVLRDLKPPDSERTRQADIGFGDAEHFGFAELIAVADMQAEIIMAAAGFKRAIP